MYKKLEEFGKDYNKTIIDTVLRQERFMKKKSKETLTTSEQVNPYSDDLLVADAKLTFDNIDYSLEVHYMTEESYRKEVHYFDKHFVTVMSTENRVSVSHLSDQLPIDWVLQLENGKCLPDSCDNVKHRENYINLVEWINTANIPCLNILSDVAVQHIPHRYTKKVSNKSEPVSTIPYMFVTFI